MTLAETIAEFVLRTRWDDLPRRVREAAKLCFTDCVGCMVAGSREPAATIALRHAEETGGRPEASVVGRGVRTSGALAAMVNGISAHVLDYDDVSASMTGHPSVTVVPAVLAAGEAMRLPGRAALEAYVVGVEVAAARGRAMTPAHYSHGWHTTSTLGVIGAAAAAGKVLALDHGRLVNALGIAASEASGLKINFGTMTKSFHAGRAAAKGLEAARLAAGGFTASPAALDGAAGFLAVMAAGASADTVARALGNPFELEQPGISLKPYTSCKGTHNGIDAALFLARAHDLDPSRIARVECEVLPVAKDILVYPAPSTALEAKFSMNFCVALALARRAVRMDDFTDAVVNDPALRALAARVEMRVSPELAAQGYFQGTWDTIVTVTTTDGRSYRKRIDHAKGDPGNPLSEDEVLAKYAECAAKVLDAERVRASAAALRALDETGDVARLSSLLHGREAAP